MPLTAADHAAFYNRIAHVYDLISDSGEEKVRERGEIELAVKPGERVLEIGFGTGHSLLELAEQVGPKGHVAGIDISTGMRDVAAKTLATKPGLASRVSLHVGDARELPFEPASFDAAFSSFTLELFENDEIPGTLAELSRVLKPGGRFGVVAMALPDEPDHASRLEHAYVWMHKHFPHIIDCHPIDTEAYLKDAGFEIARSSHTAIWTLPVAIVVAKKRG